MVLRKGSKRQLMIEALKSQLGCVTTACREIGISRGTHYSWLKKDSNYKKEVELSGEYVLDIVEKALLHKIIREKDTASTIFFLKCKGQKRGYIERNVNVNLNVDAPDSAKSMQDIYLEVQNETSNGKESESETDSKESDQDEGR